MGKETSPFQEPFAIPAKEELRPQVEAGSHQAANCLQNKPQDEEAQSAETSQGCDSLGRCELVKCPGEPRLGGRPARETLAPLRSLPGMPCAERGRVTGWDNCPVFIFEKGYYTSRIIPSSLLSG